MKKFVLCMLMVAWVSVVATGCGGAAAPAKKAEPAKTEPAKSDAAKPAEPAK